MWQKYAEIGCVCINMMWCQIDANIIRVTTSSPSEHRNHVCLRGELCLHSCPNLGNAQVWLVLAAWQCVDIQIETQKILKLLKIAVENVNLCGRNLQCVHFAEIFEKCGNMWKMRQSHIHIKLTGLGYMSYLFTKGPLGVHFGSAVARFWCYSCSASSMGPRNYRIVFVLVLTGWHTRHINQTCALLSLDLVLKLLFRLLYVAWLRLDWLY